jgi:hypothetical protein
MMGNFKLEGSIELLSAQKLSEKSMVDQKMKRLKLAKFTLTKTYVKQSLNSLVMGSTKKASPFDMADQQTHF